ncbi:DUF1302 domain-containing protein [Bermanella sp. WJH001]|uniref:DUF1302 domain-containing protein n=1 Tax=Bermanella sp. WJH001 TaxID=3048005 RepID=UPI0024BE464C|nr:DUF1302 domain-containing protein [Bermanella sp. WJH001]MDJ1537157.1 DUF1302 domain-containing protein [Bermanella sp. WJH001]
MNTSTQGAVFVSVKNKIIKPFEIAAIVSGLTLTSAVSHGVEFFMDVEGSFSSQLSIGSSWRMSEPDEALLLPGNNNDGNANFEKGDAFSQIIKGSHDLHLRSGDHGVFIRGKYWHDFALEDTKVAHGHAANGFAENEKLNDKDFNELSKFSGAALLDAYVYGMYEIGYTPIDVRLGRQVVSWGESTFILGGVNSINPVDVNAFRRPGAEIKEGLLPVNMAYVNVGLTEFLSMEAFYQLEFQETVIPGCGTYFAFNDYAPEGCDKVVLSGEGLESFDDATRVGAGYSLNRDEDGNRLAKDEGQFGIAFRYMSEALGDTEFGFYAMNIHSRLPVVSGIKATDWQSVTDAGSMQDAINNNKTNTRYYVSYPEDIQLAGLSFSTNVGSVAVSGELSHKKDVPLQINATQLLTAGLTGLSTSAELAADVAATANGADFEGYRLFDVSQAQFTMLQFFDRFLGASRYTLIAEAGYTFVHDFDEGDDAIKFSRAGIFDGSDEGYVTESSWGYRTRLVGEYNNAFAGITLKPTLAFSHDVEGFAPQPGGAFREGEQSVGFTLQADYQSMYSASISYTQYMGGDYNLSADRDFASLSLSVQF